MKNYTKYIFLIFIVAFVSGKVLHCAYMQSPNNSKTIGGIVQCNKGILSANNNNIKPDVENIFFLKVNNLSQDNSIIYNSICANFKTTLPTNHSLYILDCNLTI